MKEKTDPGKKGHKKKTKHNQVHKKANPRWQGKKKSQTGYRWGVSHPLARSSRGKGTVVSGQRSGTMNSGQARR
jgi:hypothetical protein